MKRILWVVVPLCLSFSSFAYGISIEADPFGSNDCSLSPPCTLQDALDFAKVTPGDDEIFLRPGLYDASLGTFVYHPDPSETGALTLIGAGSVIDGGGGMPGMIIDLTDLTNDISSDIFVTNIAFENGFNNSSDGGGLFVETTSADVIIANCTFTHNVTESSFSAGGGLVVEQEDPFGSVTLEHNRFTGNRADGEGGGAFILAEGSLFLFGNSFTDNVVDSSSFGLGGGLVVASEGSAIVEGNQFQNNRVEGGGGGMVFETEEGEAIFINNIFFNNLAISSGTSPDEEGGGGLLFFGEGGQPTFTNNTFVDNKVTTGDGGGMKLILEEEANFNIVANLYNNIFFNNIATASNCFGSCNDIFIDDDPEQLLMGAGVNVFNNLFKDISFSCRLSNGCTPHQNVDLTTNIDEDPLFADVSNGDFRLQAGSKAIDAGSANAPHLPDTDFQGSARIQGASPDMGALESLPEPAPPPGTENCANNTDEDGDGKIDCNDPDCAGAAACQNPPSPPSSENCANDADDDSDGMVDCDDPDCSGAFACLDNQNPSNSENCANNVDDDGDGNIDCNDPDCSGAGACLDEAGGAPSNVTVNSGCTLGTRPGNPSFALWVFAPLLLGGLRILSKARRKGEALFLFIGFFLAVSASSQASEIEVTASVDPDCTDNTCDFPSALLFAGTNDEDDILTLNDSEFDGSGGQFSYQPQPSENHSLIIQGLVPGATILDGGGTDPVLRINTVPLTNDSQANITVRGITFRNGLSAVSGGGLSIVTEDANIVVHRCNFQFNRTTIPFGNNVGGGGLLALVQNTGSVTVSESQFFRNSVTQAVGGGAVAASINGDVLLEGNTYIDNTTLDLLGPSSDTAGGGAVAVSVAGNVAVNRNTFLGNSSVSGGGLVFVNVFGSGVITNNLVSGNSAVAIGGTFAEGGGGILLVAPFGRTDMTNNTVTENLSAGDAGGLLVTFDEDQGEVNLFNNIIRGNTGAPGAFCTEGCNDIVVLDDQNTNNIGNRVNVSHNDFADIFFQCDLGQGCSPQQNVDPLTNINEDPLFAAAGLGNFHLLNGSEAIDAGTAQAPGLPLKDHDLNPRNRGANPDMGAFESIPPPNPPPTPPTTENCVNGLDDDQDGSVDCSDADCSGAAACRNTNPPPGQENCVNNLDDDGDGNIDCIDPDCSGSAACQGSQPPPQGSSENCANGADDEGDGQVDCDDTDCSGAAACAQDSGQQAPSTVDVTTGCTLGSGPGDPVSLLCLLLPLLLTVGKFAKASKSGRSR